MGSRGAGSQEPGAGSWEPGAGASRVLCPRHVGTAGGPQQQGLGLRTGGSGQEAQVRSRGQGACVGDGVGDGGDGVGALGVGAVVLVEAQAGAALAGYSRESACNTPPQPGTTPMVTFPQGLRAWGLETWLRLV